MARYFIQALLIAMMAVVATACSDDSAGSSGGCQNQETQEEERACERATFLYSAAVKIEPEITRNLQDISIQENCPMTGLEYRFKTISSAQRKILSKSQETGADVDDINLNDMLRYTLICDVETYSSNVEVLFSALNEKGITPTALSNTWPSGDLYSGLNATLAASHDLDALEFEVQIHTQASYEIKSENHEMYEEYRLDSTTAEIKCELFNDMSETYETLTIPDGALDVVNSDARCYAPPTACDTIYLCSSSTQ